jgi:hypothetical protein
VNLQEALAAAAALGVERLDAQLLLLHVLGRDAGERAWLLAHDGDALEPATQDAFRQLCARRAAGEPLAYLVGHKEFFGLRLRKAGMGASQIAQELGMLPVVSVEKRDPVSAREADAVVARLRDARVALADQAHARVGECEHAVGTVVGGPIVDDDDLQRRERLRQHRAHGSLDQPRLVVQGDDDRKLHAGVPSDAWGAGRTTAAGWRRTAEASVMIRSRCANSSMP